MIKRLKEYFPAFLFAVCVFLFLQPYMVWNASNYLRFGVIPAIYLLILIKHLDIKSGRNAILFVSFFSLILYACILRGYNLLFTTFHLSLALVPFIQTNYSIRLFYCFQYLISIVFAIGIISWFSFWLGIGLPSYVVPALNPMYDYTYTIYPFCAIPNIITGIGLFCGPFDEKGVVGTISLLVLFVDNYNLRKWYNIVIFVAGCLSFSLAFFGGSLLYLLFTLIGGKTRYVICSMLLLGVFYGVTKENAIMNELVYSRMEYDADEGTISGDNRATKEQKQYFDRIKGTSAFFFGDSDSQGMFEGTRGMINAVLDYGVIFISFYFIFFFFYAKSYKLKLKSIILFMLMLFAVLYQRPNFLHFSYIFLFAQFSQLRKGESLIKVLL